MLGGGSSMAIASMWASLASWFTPTVLFCVLNLIIAIIFLASNFKSPNHPNSPSQLTRSPSSLLQRVKSVNLSSFYIAPDQSSHDDQTPEYNNSVSQLSRAPSLLQRVRSIDYSFASFYTPNHNSCTTEPEQLGNSTSGLTRAPSLLDRVKSFKLTSSFYSNHNSGDANTMQDEHSNMDTHLDSLEDDANTMQDEHSNMDTHLDSLEDDANTMQDEHSNMDTHLDSLEDDANTMQDEHSNMDTHLDSLEDHHVTSSGNSRNNKLANLVSQNPGMTIAKRSSSNLSKSSSEKRVVALEDDEDVDRWRPMTMRAPSGIRDESVDAKADDFIKRFKQQLKLQRIDSLQRFREMLNRGT